MLAAGERPAPACNKAPIEEKANENQCRTEEAAVSASPGLGEDGGVFIEKVKQGEASGRRGWQRVQLEMPRQGRVDK